MMNTEWEDAARARIDAVIEQIMAWGAALSRDGQTPPPPAQVELLRRIYEEELPLARLIDRAHLVVHAEGPGAAHDGPMLDAMNWLTGTSARVLRALSAAWLDLRGADGRRLARRLDMRLSGMASGSLWLGYRIEAPAGGLLPEDDALVDGLADSVGLLPEAARFIDDEGLRPGIAEAFPDPAERDVLLESLYALSPTGRAGIHTLEVSASAHGSASLGNRERVVLRETLRRPHERDLRDGSFVGAVREADLDKTRIHLRGVDGVGALRAVLPEMDKDAAKRLIGETVRASGRYACDRSGRPRLLYIEKIERIEQASLV